MAKNPRKNTENVTNIASINRKFSLIFPLNTVVHWHRFGSIYHYLESIL